MIKRIYPSYSEGYLISENVRHTESFLEAMLCKEGISIKCVFASEFLIQPGEFDYFFSVFDLWKKYSITLPSIWTGGSSVCGITSINFYQAGSISADISVSGSKKVNEYLHGEEYPKLRKIVDEAEEELNSKLESSLTGRNGLYGHISRFKVYITRNPQQVAFNQAQMDGFREMVEYYLKRKGDYK